MVSHEQTAKRVDTTLERILEHTRLIAVAQAVNALKLELPALFTNRVAHDSMIGRVAYKQCVLMRGNAFG